MRILPNGIAVLDQDIISKWVEESGELCHDQNALPQILPFIKPGMTVFDIGAHIGSHTVAYAKAVGPKGHVYAFEPSDAACDCLRKNVGHLYNATAQNFGFGCVYRFMSMVDVSENAGSSYVSVDNGSTLITSIDEVCARFNHSRLGLIKMDCEGYEPFVLIGGRELLLNKHPVIVCEVNEGALNRYGFTGKALLAILDAYGYQWRNIYAEQACEGPQYDIIATPK